MKPYRLLSAVLIGSCLLATPALSQSRKETLRVLVSNNINGLDPTTYGIAREAIGVSMGIYDRLVTYDKKAAGDALIYDDSKVRGELAESFDVSSDGLKLTFKLRKGNVWHDGTPVTADDVKWSFDRHVTVKSLSGPQLANASMSKPEQFKVIDPLTFEITLDKADRLALYNLTTPNAFIVNSALAKKHATPEDPYAMNWLKENGAGSGAYIVEAMNPGQNVILKRNEKWLGGPGGKLPYFKRIIMQTVADPAARATLVEKGDADLTVDLQISDVISMEKRKVAKVISVSQNNAMAFAAINTRMPPFDNVLVRKAIAAALPYEDIFKAAVFGRGKPLFGASWTESPPTGEWPQPMPFKTNLDEAKRLMKEAGIEAPIKTTISFGVSNSATNEVIAALMKESLARIGIEAEIQKLPDSQFVSRIMENKLGLALESGSAYLRSTDYAFRIYFQGENRWNMGRWKQDEVASLIAKARFERDDATYEALAKRMITLAAAEAPVLPLWMPNSEAVMVPDLVGYTYWFHRQPDLRDFARK